MIRNKVLRDRLKQKQTVLNKLNRKEKTPGQRLSTKPVIRSICRRKKIRNMKKKLKRIFKKK